jgi:hypothetical protein
MHDTDDRRAAPPTTVRVGGMTRSALLQALRERDIQLNPAAESLFDDPRFAPLGQERVIEISPVSVGELGFGEGATYAQIVARARERRLVECPLELGPRLRMQLLDQPEGALAPPTAPHRAPSGSLTVASAPLDNADETPKGFYLRRIDGVLWLRGYWSWPGHLWSPQDVLVFARS